MLRSNQYQLLGGRYCSLHGQLAAQLKLKRVRDGKVLTLYVTRSIRALQKRLPASDSVDGVRVRLWHEHGLLYGLAESM